MDTKICYIEDLPGESRKVDFEKLGYTVDQYDPKKDLNQVIDDINGFNSDIIIMDYRLNNGVDQVYYDAPTIAATLRSKHRTGFVEKPIILISNEGKITDFYKDFLNQDLFDYAIKKQQLDDDEGKDDFKRKIDAYKESYDVIYNSEFNIFEILALKKEEESLLHSLVLKKLEPKTGQIYEYSRFINDNFIYSIGMLIGQDVLSARLGVSKTSENWQDLLNLLSDYKYTGVFSKSHDRWWAKKIEDWWTTIFGSNNLRRLDANERVKMLSEKFNFKLNTLEISKFSKSSKFWTICKGSNQAIDPFDGILILKKDYKIWQEKEYFSKEYALGKIADIKPYIDEMDIKYLRNLANS
ncbi:hypothetical protein HX13_14395 [Chryseobacterium sp. P1-3]|uniref:hypothetical protein n=1 Tax=Chryseobacterium sp. (strain P1-3) TaxID=1517683 RepID=UPI0004E781B8|nr:hypothetical protein [Chryseobacterium sp. P1-3]KFF74292.1 hypothetical protein HX13_14395 [Chryseobacterium sp. P1-3]